jgi:alkanesulfonate monooxygenase SsuD/methylene tetrahydromethanopterin reductase-like flavin-dependent oxidoreductase (luciferase family)
VHPFRFGLVAAPRGTGEQWVATARRALDLGFGTLLVPDGLGLHAPMPALATAAAAVPGLRVGPFVLAAPLRPPRAAAWEGHSMSVLTDGRFDFGIGTGRPDARGEVEQLGRPWGSGAQRLGQLQETVALLRALEEDDGHTPVLIAAGGPRALAFAAAEADIVTLGAQPATPRAEVVAMADRLRELAGPREPQLSMNVFAVGDEIPSWMARFAGDVTNLPADTLALLRGTPQQMADELHRRRDSLGVSYYAVGEAFAEPFAPVAELLAGR